ncbi:MAG: helix-hairpin-helix domain-containing protein [Anaerolineae bacterium]
MIGTWLDRNRTLIFVTLLLLAAGGVAFFYLRQPAPSAVEIVPLQTTATPTPSPTPVPTPTAAPVRVYVTGAIANSDVYFLPPGSIVKDAISAAGGFTSDADKERINQALELQDQQQIHIPRLGETDAPPPVQGGLAQQSSPSRSSAPAAATGLINLNTATVEELDSLPGIGPAIAKRIIDYRESAGSFKNAEQITEVSGIGEATLSKIKDLITVQ